MQTFNKRINGFNYRKDTALRSRRDLRQILAASKLEIGSYIENYGKYFLVRWKELGDERKLVFVDIVISPRLPERPISIRVSYECDYNLWYKCEYHEKPVPEEVEHAGP